MMRINGSLLLLNIQKNIINAIGTSTREKLEKKSKEAEDYNWD